MTNEPIESLKVKMGGFSNLEMFRTFEVDIGHNEQVILEVTRVPGGYIYCLICDDQGSTHRSATFVALVDVFRDKEIMRFAANFVELSQ